MQWLTFDQETPCFSAEQTLLHLDNALPGIRSGQASSRIRSMRRSGSAAPHNN